MKRSSPQNAKITRPNISGVVRRKRLFSLIDSGRKSVVWVSGPAGSGKTTLAASYLDARKLPCLWYRIDEGDADISTFFYYMGLAAKNAVPRRKKALPLLTPEYLGGLPVFTKRYFEELCSRVKQPFILVFDNVQDVPAGSQFHEMLAHGLSVLPDGIAAIILSRGEPPACFARFSADGTLSSIGPDEIRFTLDESKEAVRRKGAEDLEERALLEMHARTQGWAAGLAIISEALRRKRASPQPSFGDAPKEIFDYFAGEILDKLDSETRDFLLLTSFLPKMTVQNAAHLTGYDDAGKVLSRLTENNFFTEKRSLTDPVYQYHPLFREFLQGRIKTASSREGAAQLQRRAGELLENSGQVEDAAHLFREARDWKKLAGLALAHAPSFASQGRNRTLEEWLSAIPAEVLDQDPLLLYWLGVCRIPYDLHESRCRFERAYAVFKERNDASGLYLSWAGVVETYVLERSVFTPLDHWISEIESILGEHTAFPSPEIKVRVTAMIFFAMMYRQPSHPDIRLWEERLLAVLPEVEDIGLRTSLSSHLVFYYSWWSGELAKAELLIKDLRRSLNRLSEAHPFAYIVFRFNEAAHFMVTGQSGLSQEAVEDALRTAEASGIRVLDFMLFLFSAHNALDDGNFEKARCFLDRAGGIGSALRHLEASHYHFQLAWESLCLGNPNVALEHAKRALHLCTESGTPFLEVACKTGLAEVLLELDRHEEALEALEDARRMGRRFNSKIREFHSLQIKTMIYLRLGKNVLAMEALRGHLRNGRECGIYGTPWWRPEVMTEIYSRALEEGIETDYVREVIRRRGLVPQTPSVQIEQWPWPLKIHSLGGFSIERDGKPFIFSGKVQKKPLDLLKALIAFGGKDVPEEILSEALWPDSEGDLAHKSFENSLGRLRRLLGSRDAVVLRDGRVTLDPCRCWTDVRALEHMMDLAETAMQQGGASAGSAGPAEKAVTMYKGDFLPADQRAWALSFRERLKSRVIRVLSRLARCWEEANPEKAIEFYSQGIEIDGLAENFYTNIMICYMKLGRDAEAARMYHRCKAALSSGLGISPSQNTNGVYQALIRRASERAPAAFESKNRSLPDE